MSYRKARIGKFFIENGSMMVAGIGLLVTIFIPFLGIVITIYGLATAIVLSKTTHGPRSDIVFASVALFLEVVCTTCSIIIALQSAVM